MILPISVQCTTFTFLIAKIYSAINMISDLIDIVVEGIFFILGRGSGKERPEKEKIISNWCFYLALIIAFIITLTYFDRMPMNYFIWIALLCLPTGFILFFIPLRLHWIAPWKIATYIKASFTFSCIVWIAILIFIF